MALLDYLQHTNKPIYLYGMGNGADSILKRLDSRGISIRGVFVSDGFVRDKEFHGFKLCSYSQAKALHPNMIVLVAFGTSLPDVMENIVRIAREQELYAPYVPVVADGDFDDSYYGTHRSDFDFVMSRLADDFSKKVYDSIINYRLSGKIDYLLDTQSSPRDIYKLLDLGTDEIYVDLGAYKGETVTQFIEFAGGYNYIYALEPDKKSYKKLVENVGNLDRIELFNSAVSDKSGQTCFEMNSARSSKISDKGVQIDTVSVDDMLQGKNATYIKMDVEGAELSAIEGAKNTIKKYKPRLAISCYHRLEDLFLLPKAALDINPDYRVYIRHLPYIPDWDTLFYFI